MTKLFFFSTLILFGLQANNAQARKGFIPIGSVEKIQKVADLPDNDDFKSADGKYIDIGSKFTVFTIAWLPVYTEKEPELVGYTGDDTYYEIPKGEMDAIISEQKLDRKKMESMSFWNAWGGKIIIGILLLLIIWGYIPSRNKKQKEVIPQNL